MKLNHLDLVVRDVPASAAYFRDFFGLDLRTSATSDAIAILTDGHGFVLVLQRPNPTGEWREAGHPDPDAAARARAADPERATRYPEGFHLGFLLDDVAAVEALQARAKAGGALVSDVIVNGRGTMIYFTTPEGYRVEVSCQRAGFERR